MTEEKAPFANIMKYFTILIFFTLVILTACQKEINEGKFHVTPESKAFLPAADSFFFINSESITTLLVKEEKVIYFEKYCSDTDGDLFNRYYYYQYFENIVTTYSSDYLAIYYQLCIDQQGDGPRDFLKIRISDPHGNVNVTISNAYGSGLLGFMPPDSLLYEIELNGETYHDVYHYTDGTNVFYFQEYKGLIGFTVHDIHWSLTAK